MIYHSWTGEFGNIFALLKSKLIAEADSAFVEGDRARCIEAVSWLYGVFDDEQEAN